MLMTVVSTSPTISLIKNYHTMSLRYFKNLDQASIHIFGVLSELPVYLFLTNILDKSNMITIG